MSEAGRPTLLDKELFRKIEALFKEKLNLREISEALDISYATMRDWQYENYQGFADKMREWRLERMFDKSIDNIEVLQDSEDEKVNLNANTFVAETIGKKWFSKKTETDLTTNGKDLQPVLVQFIDGTESNTNTEGV